jgi:hypothetical protein
VTITRKLERIRVDKLRAKGMVPIGGWITSAQHRRLRILCAVRVRTVGQMMGDLIDAAEVEVTP